MTENELQDLIKLKRYEQPEEGYFDDFLVEFQERQRSEMLNTSARGLMLERVKAWFDFSSRANKLVIRTGMACAACAVIAMTMQFLPKISQHQLAQQIDKLPTDVAETSSDMLMLSVKESIQVSSELVRDQLHPIDFSQPETDRRPVFSTEPVVF